MHTIKQILKRKYVRARIQGGGGLALLRMECTTLTEIFGLWLIPAALELQYCGSRAATTCGSRAALKYFVCKLVFRL